MKGPHIIVFLDLNMKIRNNVCKYESKVSFCWYYMTVTTHYIVTVTVFCVILCIVARCYLLRNHGYNYNYLRYSAPVTYPATEMMIAMITNNTIYKTNHPIHGGHVISTIWGHSWMKVGDYELRFSFLLHQLELISLVQFSSFNFAIQPVNVNLTSLLVLFALHWYTVNYSNNIKHLTATVINYLLIVL